MTEVYAMKINEIHTLSSKLSINQFANNYNNYNKYNAIIYVQLIMCERKLINQVEK